MRSFLYALMFLLGMLAAEILFPISYPTSFYVEPAGTGQYTVTLNVMASHNVQLTRPMPFEKATELANTLNRDMNSHWAQQTRGRNDE